MHLTILGADPGKNNFGYSIVKVKFEPPFRYQIAKTGLVKNVVYDLTKGVRAQSKAFRKEVGSILKEYEVDVLIAERYQNRGRMMGNTIELVNYMLGVMDSLRTQDFVLITASQWKNAFNRHYDLKEFYKEIPMIPHRIDAALIAIYGSYQYLDNQAKQYDFLSKKGLATLRKRIEATND